MWMIKFGESQVNWSQFMLFLGKLAYMLPAGPTSLSVGFKSPVSYDLTLADMTTSAIQLYDNWFFNATSSPSRIGKRGM